MTAYPVRLGDLWARVPMDRVRLDAEGIPVYRYGGAFDANASLGVQRNGVIAGWWALAALEGGRTGDFLRVARWMRDSLVPRPGGAAAWEFGMPYRMGPASATPPFTGGQVLGVGLSVLTRAHASTGEASFLESARKVLPLFDRPAREGGVRYRDARGSFFGLEGDLPPVAVFDGIAFACLGLADLAAAAGIPEAARARDEGLDWLEASLPGFACHGGWSRMWLGGPPCSAFYHLLNARTAQALGELPGRPAFREAGARWSRGLSDPSVRVRAWWGEKWAYFLGGNR